MSSGNARSRTPHDGVTIAGGNNEADSSASGMNWPAYQPPARDAASGSALQSRYLGVADDDGGRSCSTRLHQSLAQSYSMVRLLPSERQCQAEKQKAAGRPLGAGQRKAAVRISWRRVPPSAAQRRCPRCGDNYLMARRFQWFAHDSSRGARAGRIGRLRKALQEGKLVATMRGPCRSRVNRVRKRRHSFSSRAGKVGEMSLTG